MTGANWLCDALQRCAHGVRAADVLVDLHAGHSPQGTVILSLHPLLLLNPSRSLCHLSILIEHCAASLIDGHSQIANATNAHRARSAAMWPASGGPHLALVSLPVPVCG